MKQPALGQHILALRQEKGFTQEDLVAQCNISVRTIQRIEAGEVVPRSYTVKTILAALGEDFESFTESTVESGLKKAFFLKIDDTKQANFLTKHLKIAWIAGIVYFVLGFAEVPADMYRMFEKGALYPDYIYIPLKLIVLTSILFFYRGFILSGNILNNYLLKIVVFIMLILSVVFYGMDIISLYFEPFNQAEIMIGQSISIGIVAQKDDDTIVFVEVKTRNSAFFGDPQSFVTPTKIKLLVKAANEYLISNELPQEARFDIIAVLKNSKEEHLEHFENAFYHF